MRKHIPSIAAASCFYVIIPTVVTMMWQSINPGVGWVVILSSAMIGTLAVFIALRNEKPKQDSIPVPDLRAIDSEHFWTIYGGKERDKLLSLLSSGGIKAWARPMAPNPAGLGWDSDLVPVDPSDWPRVYLDKPSIREDERPQVFLKRKSDSLSVKYDLYLSQQQFDSHWPWPKTLDAKDKSIWLAFAMPIALLTVLGVAMAYPLGKPLFFPTMQRSLGVERIIIRPYPSDTTLLQIGVFLKNTSALYLRYETKKFLITVDSRLRKIGVSRGLVTINPDQTNTVWSPPFEGGENISTQSSAVIAFQSVYGKLEGEMEREIELVSSCNLMLGQKSITGCMYLRSDEHEID